MSYTREFEKITKAFEDYQLLTATTAEVHTPIDPVSSSDNYTVGSMLERSETFRVPNGRSNLLVVDSISGIVKIDSYKRSTLTQLGHIANFIELQETDVDDPLYVSILDFRFRRPHMASDLFRTVTAAAFTERSLAEYDKELEDYLAAPKIPTNVQPVMPGLAYSSLSVVTPANTHDGEPTAIKTPEESIKIAELFTPAEYIISGGNQSYGEFGALIDWVVAGQKLDMTK